jgi:hypothetical protein
MFILFFLLMLITLGCLITGLIAPAKFNRFRKDKPATRGRVGVVFGVLSAFFFVAAAIAAPASTSSVATSVTPTAHPASPKATPTHSPSSTPKPTASSTPKASATPKPAAVKLTAFGATSDSWNASHTLDTRFSGGVYNPDTNLGTGLNNADYYEVIAVTPVTDYWMRFASGTSIDTAKLKVMTEFPTDTTVRWAASNLQDPSNQCYQMDVTSTTLANTIGSGDAFVEFQSSSLDNFIQTNVSYAHLSQSITAKTQVDAPGC